MSSKGKKINFVKWILLFLALVFTGLFIFKDRIFEHKVTKAKIEMFKRMYESPPEKWDDEFKQVYDSMIVKKKDTMGLE